MRQDSFQKFIRRSGTVQALGLVLAFVGPLVSAARIAAAADTSEPATTRPVETRSGDDDLVVKGLDPERSLTIGVNETRVITTRVPGPVAIVNPPDVVFAKGVGPDRFALTGLKPGRGHLVIDDRQGGSQTVEITVTADLQDLQAQLKKLLPGGKIEVSSANGAIVLKGRVPGAQLADQALQIAAPYAGTTKVINMLEVSGGQQVMLQVRFAEVSKTASTTLGVNFAVGSANHFFANTVGQVEPFGIMPNSVPPALGVPSPGPNITQFFRAGMGATLFDGFISALRENNLLRVLAEPNLTTVSGQTASFLAGGQFPVPVPQSGAGGTGAITITVEYKEYGVRLNFTPVVLGDGRIQLKVAPEVSDLDPTHNVSFGGFTIPALVTRSASTTVELQEGQTLALAGLLNTRVTADSQATPLLGDLPILGALFRSVRFERDETELVVMVTPKLVGGLDPGQVPPLPGERWRYPTEAELFWHRDLGGPMPDVGRGPSEQAPPQFHGTYGFAPVNQPNGGTGEK